jgi:DNA (cytosine-5)-methyltransferase 1
VFVEWMMGFPEGWVSDLSRTQALKALGNAVVPQQGAAALSMLIGGDVQSTPEPSMTPLTVRSSI